MTTSRRAARRAALFMLFQWDVTGAPLGSTFEGESDDFARDPAKAVAERSAFLDRRIDEATDDWPADRLGALERNVLRLGIYELEKGDVPREVAIDEAVRLAKRYSSDEAGKLVNGILGRIARETAANER
jgi:N utilization substance protein B